VKKRLLAILMAMTILFSLGAPTYVYGDPGQEGLPWPRPRIECPETDE